MYNDTKVFDIHGHVSAPDAKSYALSLISADRGRRSPLSGDPGLSVSAEIYESAYRHVEYIAARDVDVQILGPNTFTQVGVMPTHLMSSWAEYVNDTIARQVQMFPDRFVGAAMLPQDSDAPDTKHCLSEMDRCVYEYGFQAVYLSPDPKGMRTTPGLHEPYWNDLYENCETLGIPIIVHGTNCHDQRGTETPAGGHWVGFLMEEFLAHELLSHTDVFGRFPDLRVVICHCGGALDRFIKTDTHLGQEDYSNNLFYDTCSFDLSFLEAAIKQRGVPQMLFGSEAPGPGSAIRPETGRSCDYLVEEVAKFDFLTEDDRLDILNRNVLKVFPGLAGLAEQAER
jgi:predicted TIM-barrel fold metal-dependent hydrolase